jgi:hypothetical protein
MGPVWPRLGSEPNNIKEHATFLHEACAQLKAVRGTHTTIPSSTVEPIIDSVLHFVAKITQHLEDQPDTRLAAQIRDIFKDQLKEQREAQIKEHEALKSAIKTATAPLQGVVGATSQVASWAQIAAATGPPPGQVTPPSTVPSSGNSSTLTAYKGREVIVKLLDHGLAQRLRQLSPAQLKNKVNNILQETPNVKDIKVLGAHQLKSGDVTVITESLENATELQTHTEWTKGLGPRAEVIRTTYGAIVHGIVVKSVNMKDQQGTIQRILAENHSVIPHAVITYVGWLTKGSTQKRSSSMVVEFTRPEMANSIIYAGFLWEGLIHTCQLYDRSCRIKQCLRCYNYGHIGTQCSAPQACGHCAGGHESRSCTLKLSPGFVPKCTVCKGPHTAWNAACPARQKEIQRVERAKQTRSHYWPTLPPRRVTTSTDPSRSCRQIPPSQDQTTGLDRSASQEPGGTRPLEHHSQRLIGQTDVDHALQTPTPERAPAERLDTRATTPPREGEPREDQEGESQSLPTAVDFPITAAPIGEQDDYFIAADDWLQNFDFDDPIAIGDTPALSTVPDDQLPGSTPSALKAIQSERRSRGAILPPPAHKGMPV